MESLDNWCVLTLLNYYLNSSGLLFRAAVVSKALGDLASLIIKTSIPVCLVFDTLEGADDLFSNQLETERRVIDLHVNVRLLPEDHQGSLCLKSQVIVWQNSTT